jgi:hypothetical protein
MCTELDRLRRICDALVEAFEAHSETSRTDRWPRRATSALTVQRARSEAGLWTARQVADRYAVTRDFVYAVKAGRKVDHLRRLKSGPPLRDWEGLSDPGRAPVDARAEPEGEA